MVHETFLLRYRRLIINEISLLRGKKFGWHLITSCWFIVGQKSVEKKLIRIKVRALTVGRSRFDWKSWGWNRRETNFFSVPSEATRYLSRPFSVIKLINCFQLRLDYLPQFRCRYHSLESIMSQVRKDLFEWSPYWMSKLVNMTLLVKLLSSLTPVDQRKVRYEKL